jgi:hypothetical protein
VTPEVKEIIDRLTIWADSVGDASEERYRGNIRLMLLTDLAKLRKELNK